MMRRADFNSDAEYYRAHGAVFRLALELGCTPKEAEIEQRRRENRAEREEVSRRLAAKMHAPLTPGLRSLAHDEPEPRKFYWQERD